MWIGCDGCPVDGSERAAAHCHTCVVAVFTELPVRRAQPPLDPGDPGRGETDLPLDSRERAAVTALAAVGLISAEVAAAARARRERPGRRVAG